MVNDCSCVIVFSLGGDDDEEEDIVVVVSNETLRCSVDVEELISSFSQGEIFFLFDVVVVPVDDLMT